MSKHSIVIDHHDSAKSRILTHDAFHSEWMSVQCHQICHVTLSLHVSSVALCVWEIPDGVLGSTCIIQKIYIGVDLIWDLQGKLASGAFISKIGLMTNE